jgi:aspartate aminotransferase
MPQGAFYAFPYIDKLYNLPKFDKIFSEANEKSRSKVFCDILLEKYNVAAVPGVAFGDDNALRLSYALGEADIRKGLERIQTMVKDLS